MMILSETGRIDQWVDSTQSEQKMLVVVVVWVVVDLVNVKVDLVEVAEEEEEVVVEEESVEAEGDLVENGNSKDTVVVIERMYLVNKLN